MPSASVAVRNSRARAKEVILDMIAKASIGDALPTVRDMMANLGVSQLALDSVLAELESHGYIERKRGSGIYIKEMYPKYSTEKTLISVHMREFGSPFNRFLLEGVRDEAGKHGFNVVIDVQHDIRERQRAEETRRLPAGTIIVSKSWFLHDINYLGKLKELQKRADKNPFVSIDFNLPGIMSDLVVCDNIAAGEDGIRLLEEKGCRSILVVTVLQNMTCAQRAEGIEKYLRDSNSTLKIHYHGITSIQASNRARYRQILSAPDYDGVLCLVPHQIGQIVLETLMCGRRPNTDVHIASIVDTETAEVYKNEVICLIKPWEEMGRASVELILGRLEGRFEESFLLKKLKVAVKKP